LADRSPLTLDKHRHSQKLLDFRKIVKTFGAAESKQLADNLENIVVLPHFSYHFDPKANFTVIHSIGSESKVI